MRRFKLRRGLTEYTKVQSLIGKLIRGRSFFINSKKNRNIEYLDIGCGPNITPGFVNLDYNWTPKIDVCWDLTLDKLPFSSDHFSGVYTEHCFEHIPFASFEKIMAEIFRILKPNGTFRLIMPDGELYLDIYHRQKMGELIKMPYEDGYLSPMQRINGVFRNHGHQFIYDFKTVKLVLEKSGFKDIEKRNFNEGRDKMLLKDTLHRAPESLYVEAVK